MKKIVSLLSVLLILSILLCACGENASDKTDTAKESEKQTEGTRTDSDGKLSLILDGKAMYGIVRASDMSDEAANAMSQLFARIYKITGVRLPYITDDENLEDGIGEILFGNTSRKESAEVIASLDENGYAIKVVGDSLVVVGDTDMALVHAIETFSKECFDGAEKGSWELDRQITFSGVLDKINAYVDVSGSLTATAVRKSNLDIEGPQSSVGAYKYSWAQGGCTVGKYLYTCMITDDSVSPTKCVIVKSDLELGITLSKSKELELGHANDITYNPDDNVLVIASCVEDGKINGVPMCRKLFIVNPDTLELEKTVMLEKGSAVSIDYDTVNKRYISIGYQAQTIYIYDRDFNLTDSFGGDIEEGYSSQGILTDGAYLYALEYYHKEESGRHVIKNQLRIFDLFSQKAVAVVKLDIGVEAENIVWWEGKFYVSCNNIYWDGMEFYEVEIISS